MKVIHRHAYAVDVDVDVDDIASQFPLIIINLLCAYDRRERTHVYRGYQAIRTLYLDTALI
jgi:hypothetical protein